VGGSTGFSSTTGLSVLLKLLLVILLALGKESREALLIADNGIEFDTLVLAVSLSPRTGISPEPPKTSLKFASSN
jgi:hypothetical protein